MRMNCDLSCRRASVRPETLQKLARLARRKPKVFALVSIGYGWIFEMEEQSDDKQRDVENKVPGGTLV